MIQSKYARAVVEMEDVGHHLQPVSVIGGAENRIGARTNAELERLQRKFALSALSNKWVRV